MTVITQTVSVCKECDHNSDPLEVPEEHCGHDAQTHRQAVPVRAILTTLSEEELDALANRLNDAYAVLRTVPHHTQAVSPITNDRVNMSGLSDEVLSLASIIRP